MRDLIISKLKEIEKEENVRILLAVESGSRAWGFASPDSDYDVRFIYVRKTEDYLKLEGIRDVLEYPINDVLDISGWDLNKAFKLLYKSNPTLFEWFSSPIIYMKEDVFFDKVKNILDTYFSSAKGVHHYLHMAEGNYREYLKGEEVKAKKYFYVLRPILACRWILEKGTPPPMLFKELLGSQMREDILPYVEKLLDIKVNSPEIKLIPKIAPVNDYIDESLVEINEKVKGLPNYHDASWDVLNELFYQNLMR